MKHTARHYLYIFAVLLIVGCGRKSLNESTLPIGIKESKLYFTQVTLQYEKGRHLTTNYRKGTLLPINTQVRLEHITSDDIYVEILPDNRKLHIENVTKHTGDDTIQAFNKLFGEKPVNLNHFSKREREHILNGKVTKGMSKAAVIAAIGYPPITETSSLQMPEWTYWNSRFNRFIVKFQGDKVTEISD